MSNYYIGPRDPQPKRRKSPDNPYNLFSVDRDTDHARYFVEFVDGNEHYQQEEISRELFDVMNDFELQDLSYLNEIDRHYERSEQTEEELNQRALNPPKPLDEEFIERLEQKRICDAFATLNNTQQRRVIMHFQDDKTYAEIAMVEGCTFQSIHESITGALKKIKKFLLNTLKNPV